MPIRFRQAPYLRIVFAFLAFLGASWASVDMHQHETGIHNPVACSVCSLEEVVSHGFTPQVDFWVFVPQIDTVARIWQQCESRFACIYRPRIRAPPTV